MKIAEAAKRLIEPGEAVLVAVSGGVDSMVLLDALFHGAKELGWRLHVTHLNHQLRGRSSDGDEALVRKTAKRLRLPVSVERIAVGEIARTRKVSIEMAARDVRHEFLARMARAHGIGTICLAHHRDDQVELFFLRLLRGSSPEGLAGMEETGRSPADKRLRVIRPLLRYGKEELIEYATAHGVKFREDRTNRSVDILRNRIRHELIPLMEKKYQPGIRAIVERLMDLLREESRVIESVLQVAQEARKEPKKSGTHRGSEPAGRKEGECEPTDVGCYGVALQRRRINRGLIDLGIQPSFKLVEELRLKGRSGFLDSSSGKLAGKEVIRNPDGELAVRDEAKASFNGTEEVISLEKGGRKRFAGVEIGWEITGLRGRGSNSVKSAVGRELFDAEKVGDSIVLRHWRPGDRFQPIGMSGAVKLQDLFVNQKIPRADRHKLLIAATAAGEIVWVEGLRISERFKLDKESHRRLKWTWRRL